MRSWISALSAMPGLALGLGTEVFNALLVLLCFTAEPRRPVLFPSAAQRA